MKHTSECNGYHTTCEKCDDEILKICCNAFGAPQYCELHEEEEEMSNIELIKDNPVYQQVLADSIGGIMYNVANQGKYDTTEIFRLWNEMSPGEQSSAGGIMTGAINFLKGK